MTNSSPRAGGLAFHPFANLFPLIEGREFDELCADIAAHGLREKIVIHEGMILDGRNRYRAAVKVGLFPEDVYWKGSVHFTRFQHQAGGQFSEQTIKDGPLAYVLSLNLHRRHLSESQRAMIASKLATLKVGRPSEWQGDGKSSNLSILSDVKQDDAAAMLNVSRSSVQTAGRVRDHGAPELVEAVERGEVKVSAAAELAKLPVSEQLEILRGADSRAFARVARERRAEKTGSQKSTREAREADLASRQRALPNKRYGVILADPEWRFEPFSRETGMEKAADNHYPTSPLEAIKARGVEAIAADDAVLFLWATAPMLPQALEVMAAWGFSYKSHVIWRKAEAGAGGRSAPGKLVLGTGYWFRNGHELLLVGTRGNVPAPAMGSQFGSMLDAAPRRHSEKPEIFHELIEVYFPNLRRIELNARQARAGWDAWGLEAPAAVGSEGARAPAGPERDEEGETAVQQEQESQPPSLGAPADGRTSLAGAEGDADRHPISVSPQGETGGGVASSGSGGLQRSAVGAPPPEVQAVGSEAVAAVVPSWRGTEAQDGAPAGPEPKTDSSSLADGPEGGGQDAPSAKPLWVYGNLLVSHHALRGKHSRVSAAPILRQGVAAGLTRQQMADDLGHPVGTVLSWLFKLGLTGKGEGRAAPRPRSSSLAGSVGTGSPDRLAGSLARPDRGRGAER